MTRRPAPWSAWDRPTLRHPRHVHAVARDRSPRARAATVLALVPLAVRS